MGAIELMKTFQSQITGGTETSSTITLLVTNSIGLVENGIQVCKYSSSDLILAVVYRSQNGNVGTLLEILSELFVEMKSFLILGDFNICNNKKPNNAVKKTLSDKGFQVLINESTQILGGHIDHAYWKNFEDLFEKPSIERYTPYYSDHDALCLTLKRKVL